MKFMLVSKPPYRVKNDLPGSALTTPTSLLKYHRVISRAADRYKIYHKVAGALDEVHLTRTAAVLTRSLRCHMELLEEASDAVIHWLEEEVDGTVKSDLDKKTKQLKEFCQTLQAAEGKRMHLLPAEHDKMAK